jgi:hypothetical protein
MQQTLQTITACIHRFSMLIHRMIILTTDLLRATFSLIFCHQKLKLGKEKKQQGPTKKKYSQEAAGALSPPAPPSYSLEAWHHLLPKINCRNKAKWAWCSLLLSEEFQREWTDKLTLVHHITTLQEK